MRTAPHRQEPVCSSAIDISPVYDATFPHAARPVKRIGLMLSLNFPEHPALQPNE
jgi:hypothetical protein